MDVAFGEIGALLGINIMIRGVPVTHPSHCHSMKSGGLMLSRR